MTLFKFWVWSVLDVEARTRSESSFIWQRCAPWCSYLYKLSPVAMSVLRGESLLDLAIIPSNSLLSDFFSRFLASKFGSRLHFHVIFLLVHRTTYPVFKAAQLSSTCLSAGAPSRRSVLDSIHPPEHHIISSEFLHLLLYEMLPNRTTIILAAGTRRLMR